jgi:hypothetical protein
VQQSSVPELTGSFDVKPNARRPSRRGTNLALVGQFLIVVKSWKDHDIRSPILGMGREVAILRCIPILVKATSNLPDLQRPALLHPLLNQTNCAEKSVDEGRGAQV